MDSLVPTDPELAEAAARLDRTLARRGFPAAEKGADQEGNEVAPEPESFSANHPAFFKHDTTVAETHKALTRAYAAKSLTDRTDAVARLFDVSKGHKHAAREFDGLASSMERSDAPHAAKARGVAKAHRMAARRLEEAALDGKRLSAARKAVADVEERTGVFTEALGGVRAEHPRRIHTEDVSIGRLEAYKRRARGPEPRPVSQIRRALRTGQTVTPQEAEILRMATATERGKDAGDSELFDGAKDALKMQRSTPDDAA